MKRLIVFLVLVGGGFLLLHQLVGGDLLVPSTAAGEREPGPGAAPRGAGVGIRQGAFGATAESSGELRYSKPREIPQPDGSVLKETVFSLHAKDSRPLGSGLQELDDVLVTLFERGVPAATITASRALVALGTDKNGEPSFDVDKEVTLHDAVFATLEGSRAQGLRLEMDRANALVDDKELHLYTPAADDPVRLSFAGERDITLFGKGLQARLPSDRNGALQRIDIVILSESVIATDGASIRSRGRLHYTEDTANRAGRLSLDEHVELQFDRGAKLAVAGHDGLGAGAVTATGDQLMAWITRDAGLGTRPATSERSAWRLLQLSGAPATVDLAGLHLSTPRLSILPGLHGAPFWITASGGASAIEVGVAPGGPTATTIRARSPRHIHLWQAGEHLGAIHRAFGFPQWTIAPIDHMRVMALEGQTHLDDGERSVEAGRGVHIFHLDPARRGVIARGFGEVALDQHAATAARDRLHVEGNDGFRLLADEGRETFDLGPDHATEGWRMHRYRLQHGDLIANGTGSCRLERDAERTSVSLHAGEEAIAADLRRHGVQLDNVRWLGAELGDRELRWFRLAGIPATATVNRAGETFVATAPRLEQTGRASLRMSTPDAAEPERWRGLQNADFLPRLLREQPATATRAEQTVATTAPLIDILYLGDRDVLVDAQADRDDMAHIEATLGQGPDSPPTNVSLAARRLRALPFAISALAAGAHAGGTGPVELLPFSPWRSPWLLCDEVMNARIGGPGAATFEGSAHRMLLSAGAQSGLLIGNPETLEPAQATRSSADRVITARGAQVRMSRDEKMHLQAFRAFPGRSTTVLPEIETHSTAASGVLAHMRASCRGDIEVVPTQVLFHGPVSVQSIDVDGSTRQDGLGIVARELTMDLHPESGEVLRAFGRDVELDWSRVSGRAAEMDLDLRWNRCVARDADGARVTLANGRVITGEKVTVNYRTLAFSGYKIRVEQQANDGLDDRVVPR